MLNPALTMPAPDVAIGTRPDAQVLLLRRIVLIAILTFFVVCVPSLNVGGAIANDKVQKLGRYFCYALVALGADLIWGYAGLLSLCQALFFCVGGYAMAMFLSLPQGGGDVRPEYNNIPQFMFFNNVTALPAFWKPFQSLPLAVMLGLFVASSLACVFGFFIFRSRVRGVYFSIVTQAVAWGMWLLICQNEMLLGGTNGLTNFSKSFSQERGWVISLYLLTLLFVTGGYLLCRAIVRSRAGRVMVAIRDKEMRLYFAGYKPYAFKVFAFTVGAALASVGGMLYPAQFTIITPQNMDVQASIEVVIMVAVGGRGRLWGAVFGAVLLLTLKGTLSSDLARVWPYLYGTLFVAVVLFFPDGFVGLWDRVEKRVADRAGALAISSAVAPVAAVSIFALSEVLGLTPAWMQSVRVRGLPLHYYLVIAVMVAIFPIERYIAGKTAREQVEGFGVSTPSASSPAVAVEAN